MGEGTGHPGGNQVAQITGRRCWDVIQRLTGGHCSHRPVTIFTTAQGDLRMINRSRQRRPGGGAYRMASITIIGGRCMTGGFTACSRAVVATDAGSGYLAVIHPVGQDWFPQCGEFVMTGIANIGGRNMDRGLAAGGGAVVAGYAITAERRMIRRAATEQPGTGDMAGIALRGSSNMSS